jgi:hypothetical protein
MTVTTTFVALAPILWATGIGSDVMRRIAAPMVGGIVTSFLGELIVYPAVYFIWRSLKLQRTELFPDPDKHSDGGVGHSLNRQTHPNRAILENGSIGGDEHETDGGKS